VDTINAKYRADGWLPVVYRPVHHQHEEVAKMYRAADVCVVSSLHDGMNLVAKEFVASRNDEHGVLVLSEFTGAARELDQAVHVNPYAVDSFAAALHRALLMSPEEQRRRMRALRQRVNSNTVFDWASSLLLAACQMEPVR
jgi:trehalose-6-phosphate synthase